MNALAIILIIAGYALFLLASPLRHAQRDAWGCLRRYPVLWRRLALLGFANALFFAALDLSLHLRGFGNLVWMRSAWPDPNLWLTGSPESLWWLPPSSVRAALWESALPALESLAGLFNNVVSTFPIAITAALALLFRARYRTLLVGALRKRFGPLGWVLFAGVLLGGLAVVAKAVLYFQPAWISAGLTFRLSLWVMWPAALFEYLFGLGVQLYLILHAYAWVRGVTFEPEALRELALRRLGASARWAAIVLLLGSLLVELPQFLNLGWGITTPLTGKVWPHVVLSVVLLLGCSMQAWLALHGETLRRAAFLHVAFVRRHWLDVLWFLLVAALHLYAVQLLRTLGVHALGENTGLGIAWKLVWPWIAGVVAGWMLALWVCLFKRLTV